MDKIENISLAFCCREKLDKNLNCKTCSKTITDFRDKAPGFLHRQFANPGKTVCGIFNKSQLNQNFVRYSALTLLAAGILNLNSCSEELLDEQQQLSPEVEIEVEIPMTGIIIEVMAEPQGGYENFQKEIQSRINYPAGLSMDGKCFVEMTITSFGVIENVSLIKGFHPLADQEAVRVLSSLKIPFRPGEQRGVPVDTKWIVPVVFDPGTKDL